MRKKDLETLPRIPLTKELENKALVHGKEKNYYKQRRNLWRYGYVMNSRYFRGILKIGLYRCADIRKGIKYPAYEIFLNLEGEEYITRERIVDGKEVMYKWRTAMIENLDNCGWYSRDYDRFAAANRGTIENVRLYLKEKDKRGPVYEISAWQHGCKRRLENKQILKKTKEWDAEMDKIPQPPNDFMRWMRRNAFDGENRMYYPYGEKGFCTACQRLVPLVKDPKHLKEVKCPICRKKVQLIHKTRRKRTEWTKQWNWICCIQKYQDGIVVRNFIAIRVEERNSITGIPKMEYITNELNRVLIKGTQCESYNYEDYKRRGERWVRESYPNFGNNRCKLYTANLNRVIPNSVYHISNRMGLEITDRYANDHISIEKLLVLEAKYPLIEMTMKAGLYHLGRDMLVRESEIPAMQQGNTLAKKLGIDNARMKRLKEQEGGRVFLEWLKYEKKKDTVLDDEDIKKMENEKETPDDVEDILSLLSLKKIVNYCEKQSLLRGDDEENQTSISYVLMDWRDYIGMLQKYKMDIHNEQLLKPADLKIAHNELVARMDMEVMEDSILEITEKYQHVNDVCQALKRYEYADDKFCIVAPKDVRDIFNEGMVLKHCIHTCEYYFNRMETRETYLMFLRRAGKEDTPWYTIEVEPGGNIRQKKSVLNEAYSDLKEALPFLQKWQKWIQETLTNEEKQLAKVSDQKRREEYEEMREEKKVVWHGRLAGTLLADALESDFMEAV